jgi:hypothetical protein
MKTSAGVRQDFQALKQRRLRGLLKNPASHRVASAIRKSLGSATRRERASGACRKRAERTAFSRAAFTQMRSRRP